MGQAKTKKTKALGANSNGHATANPLEARRLAISNEYRATLKEQAKAKPLDYMINVGFMS